MLYYVVILYYICHVVVQSGGSDTLSSNGVGGKEATPPHYTSISVLQNAYRLPGLVSTNTVSTNPWLRDQPVLKRQPKQRNANTVKEHTPMCTL